MDRNGWDTLPGNGIVFMSVGKNNRNWLAGNSFKNLDKIVVR